VQGEDVGTVVTAGLKGAAMLEDLKKDAAQRMQKCVTAFQADLKKLRTGRAHTEPDRAHQGRLLRLGVPLKQVANIASRMRAR
jgi:ribosome recycling factor